MSWLGKRPIVRLEADLWPPVHRPREQQSPETARVRCRYGLGEEQPDVTAVPGTRPFQRDRHIAFTAGGDEGQGVGRPIFLVEVDGQESACVVDEQRIDAGHEVPSPPIGSNAILSAKMALDHLGGNRHESLVWAVAAFDLRLTAHAAHPFIGAGRSVA